MKKYFCDGVPSKPFFFGGAMTHDTTPPRPPRCVQVMLLPIIFIWPKWRFMWKAHIFPRFLQGKKKDNKKIHHQKREKTTTNV
jgi:hypothetical protein